MLIKYGYQDKIVDVTDICFSKLIRNNVITIPADDIARGNILSDPAFGCIKTLYIIDDDGNVTEYDNNKTVKIDINTKQITVQDYEVVKNKLSLIQNKLKINYGSFQNEIEEQRMAVNYLTGYEKVLEIGGNIGRNSLIIAHILNEKNNSDFVSLECDQFLANVLTQNRDLNNLKFHVESSALSKKQLIQKKPDNPQALYDANHFLHFNYHTIQSDELYEGFTVVNTLTFDELCAKYNIYFDTLILDCEGAFYYILNDMPEILNNINLIIVENDYAEIIHKLRVDNILKNNNFYVDYVEGGGWGECRPFFYQVWKRDKV